MRALGVTLLTRWPTAPDIPPLNEAGVPGFDASGWFMMSGPAGTPQPIVERLHADLKAVMGSADVQQAFNRIGVVPVVSPPLAELPKFIATEQERWGKVVKQAGLRGDAVAHRPRLPSGDKARYLRLSPELRAKSGGEECNAFCALRCRVVAGSVVAASCVARADDYPSRPITLILPLGAGGAMDILARAQFEPKLKERLGKPIIIENRTGGGTVIAATATAKAPPDGYTLFMAPAGTLTTNATLYKKLPYDPAKDFTPIALTGLCTSTRCVYVLLLCRRRAASAIEPDSDGYTVNTEATWSTVRCRSTAMVMGWISSLARGATMTPPTMVSEPLRENSFTKPSLKPSIFARGLVSSAACTR